MLDYDPVQRDGRSQWILNVLGDSAKLYELNNRPSHHIYIHAQTEGHGRTWGAKKQFTIRSWDHDALDYAVQESRPNIEDFRKYSALPRNQFVETKLALFPGERQNDHF